MSITIKKTTIALTASAALSAGLALSPMMINADTNPFASTALSSGYMQLAEATGGADEGATEHQKNVTGDENGTVEDTEMMTEDQATGGADEGATELQKSVTEGKDGEGKCGAEKKAAKEAKCGAEMKKDMEEGSTGIKK